MRLHPQRAEAMTRRKYPEECMAVEIILTGEHAEGRPAFMTDASCELIGINLVNCGIAIPADAVRPLTKSARQLLRMVKR